MRGIPGEGDKTGGGTWKHVPEMLSTDVDLDSIFQTSSKLKIYIQLYILNLSRSQRK
jgi:hypothetical protein